MAIAFPHLTVRHKPSLLNGNWEPEDFSPSGQLRQRADLVRPLTYSLAIGCGFLERPYAFREVPV